MNSVPGATCKADVWGYASQPVDVFAAGMCICILCCGFPVWQKALLTDPTFAYVHNLGKDGIVSLLKHWQKPLPASDALDLMTDMLRTDAPSERPSSSECLARPWFTALTDAKTRA
jgi:serine/threonine protein kinase